MKVLKVTLVIGGIIVALWVSLIAVVIFVERIVLVFIGTSVLRSIVGLSLYFLWLALWFFIIKAFINFLLKSTRGSRALN
ncbi:MAG: hypothetical protein DRJ46_01170 [Thermoprotei archaeon]|nr:MAG: hypothetical protein DRJ46_01170 [Thermoprotei archaeon]